MKKTLKLILVIVCLPFVSKGSTPVMPSDIKNSIKIIEKELGKNHKELLIKFSKSGEKIVDDTINSYCINNNVSCLSSEKVNNQIKLIITGSEKNLDKVKNYFKFD